MPELARTVRSNAASAETYGVEAELSANPTDRLDPLHRAQDRIRGSAFVNALLSWTAPGEHWGASVSVKNIFETTTPQAVTYTPSAGIWYFVTGDPRTVLVTVSYKL